MATNGKSIFRLVLYGGVIVYLVCDLFILDGALRRFLTRATQPPQDIAARVYGHPITQSQLARCLNEQLWLEGKSTDLLTPDELEIARKKALDELIAHELLRLQVNRGGEQLPVTDEEINQRLRRLVGRFESKGALETAMKAQGIPTEQNLRERLAARIRQEKFVARHIRPTCTVTDEEAQEWFNENQSSISLPERIEVRHIFLPTLDHPSEQAEQKLTAALAELTGGKKNFATLAKELSEDPASRENGGALGWMTRDRLPVDFAAPVFSLASHTPTLVRTRLGWHLVEVTGRKTAEPSIFEMAKPEIIAALEASKRSRAIDDFRDALRRSHSEKVEILARAGEKHRD